MPSSRNQIVTKLKDELDSTLALVVHARESLENELDSEWAQKKLSVDAAFLKKLTALTASFNSLTDAKIRLDKAEKQMEESLTPQEEAEAVISFLASLKAQEAWDIFNASRRARKGLGDEPDVSQAG